MKISEEMVTLTAEASYAAYEMSGGSHRASIRAAIEAVAPLILEEAAKVARSLVTLENPQDAYDQGWQGAAEEIGDRIRALISEPQTAEKPAATP